MFSAVWAFFSGIPNLLPVTVFSAVALFVFKETLEGLRRRKANKRKRRAMRRMLKDELERNKWTLRSLHDCVNTLESIQHRPTATLVVRESPMGGRFMRIEGPNDYAQHPIPKIHSDFLKSNILEVALNDEEVFEQALGAIDAIAEMEHVLKSILEYAEDQEATGLEGFPDYAHKELDDCEATLAAVYTKLTGKPYEEFRLR